MKKILLIILIIFLSFQIGALAEEEAFYSSTSDGYLELYGDDDDDWADNRVALEAEFVYDGDYDLALGVLFYAPDDYDFYRTALFFDTSSIPADATIDSATLSLYGKQVNLDVDFDVVIQDGMPTYPHDPLVVGDYNQAHYSGDGGSLTTFGWSLIAYNVITLNETGLSWIKKGDGAVTKFILRSSKDIDNTPPGGESLVYFWSTEEVGEKGPILYVEYSVPAVGNALFFGTIF